VRKCVEELYFDSSKVSAEEMKEKVESMAGGIYKVKGIN
jgi:hypothetical protein